LPLFIPFNLCSMIVMMMGEEDLEKFDKEVQAGSGSPQSADCISIENAGLAACLTNGSSQERDASAITVSTTPTYEPPPNGGLTAWLQVVGSFFLFFNTWSVRFHLCRLCHQSSCQVYSFHVRNHGFEWNQPCTVCLLFSSIVFLTTDPFQ
jgi:hypothetical protein